MLATAASRHVLVVANATVLAGWFLRDEETLPGYPKAEITDVSLRRVTLLAPPLLMHQLVSALSVATKRRSIATEDDLLAWEALSGLGILLEQPGRYGPSILRLSSLPGVTAYDASYVPLAESHGCTYYTAGERLVAPVRGHSELVPLISEYPLG